MKLFSLLKHELARETAAWVQEGLVSAEQARTLCKRYGLDSMDRSSRSLGYQVLTALGFLFIGLALITLISANWQEIPRGLRMAGVVAITLSVNLYALYRYQSGALTAAGNWLFLGGLCYGASIMLISQIYHIDEYYPDGIFWWAMGVLPIALLLENGLLMLLSVTLGYIWFFMESSLNFYPTLFPIFLAALTWHMYRAKQNNLLFMALVGGAALWLEYSLAWWLGDGRGYHPAADHLSLGGGLLLLCYGAAQWLAAKKDSRPIEYGVLLENWTLRISVLALLVFSFKAPWRALLETRWEMPLASFLNSLGLSVVALLLIRRAQKPALLATVAAVLYLCLLAAVQALHDPSWSTMLQITDNVLLLCGGVWLVVEGLRTARSYQFYLGIFMILMTGFLRYLDFIGDYVGAALLFALLAAILLAAAHYWHRRYPDAGGSGL